MRVSLLCFLLLSPCPGGGAISVAWFMCSLRGTPILSDRQNNDIRLTEALNKWCMQDYVISCVWLLLPFWHHRFTCVDQTVLFRQASTAWATISSTSEHYICQEKIRHKGCEGTPPLHFLWVCGLPAGRCVSTAASAPWPWMWTLTTNIRGCWWLAVCQSTPQVPDALPPYKYRITGIHSQPKAPVTQWIRWLYDLKRGCLR